VRIYYARVIYCFIYITPPVFFIHCFNPTSMRYITSEHYESNIYIYIGLYNLFFFCLLFLYSVIWILCSLNPCSSWFCACLYQSCQNFHNISVNILCYLPNSTIIHGVQIGLLSYKVLSIVNQGEKLFSCTVSCLVFCLCVMRIFRFLRWSNMAELPARFLS